MARAHVVTGNRTSDGAVVYLTAERTLTRSLRDALLVHGEAERDALLRFARGREATLCDPYAIEVEVDGELRLPLSAREQIRAAGADAVLARLGYA